MPPDADLLTLAATLARRAAHAINAVRAAGFAIERKSDASPVTEADRLAEAIIVEALRDATPEIPVIAEEAMEAGPAPAIGRTWWCVDPLDGTREFAANRDHFTVNIGLIRDGHPVLGAVCLPATDELFAGRLVPGGPHLAWKEDAGGRRPIAARPTPPEGLTVLASRHHGDDPRLDALLAGRQVARIEKLGSAVKFVRVAEGAADLYPRFGRTMEWDTAAPQAVLEAAGGQLLRFDGTPLGYGKPGFANPGFLVTGRP